NRAGVPLLEIVTEPDFRSAEEVAAYMEYLRRLVRWLDISDGNMEEGSLRCDVNISVRPIGQAAFGQRCEIKNMNSMRFAKRAIEHEAARQAALLSKGDSVEQETRGFDPDTGRTFSLREKENAQDYRYFPEPDLPPVLLTETYIERVKNALPPLPHALENSLQATYGLPAYDAALLTQERSTATCFLVLAEAMPAHLSDPAARINRHKSISNLLINRLLPWSASTGQPLSQHPATPARWHEFLGLIESGQISASSAYQRLFPAWMEQPQASPADLAASMNLLQSADADFLDRLVEEVLARFPEKVAEYRKGKKGLIGLFMGEVMKASGGKADPKATTRLLEERLRG
ncbi:MAG TPA: Asp-tRNA(Asn)/Glu-tRNA(Gln) amidotransferase subunit GatB, partial [Saprospiraceae bacterium]|nr:Asp-tRNA(Asn)/Glu-tRNA(Gln) amidotransferase subunit GatB [Saprospiraceae bacterium]